MKNVSLSSEFFFLSTEFVFVLSRKLQFHYTGVQKDDRQYGCNEFLNLKAHASRSAASNGAAIGILYHDCKTHAKIEMRGGSVQRAASYMAVVGPDLPKEENVEAGREVESLMYLNIQTFDANLRII